MEAPWLQLPSSAKAVRDPDEILLDLLERLADATKLTDVNIAAGAIRNDLLGVDETPA
jgi:hypothetical protein